MDVKELLEAKNGAVISVAVDSPVPEAAKVLAGSDQGVVAVTDSEGRLDGLLSARDISRGVTEHGAALVEKPVGDLMTRSAVRCGPDDSIVDVLSLMHNHGVRHLPVMERDDMVGIVSLRDVTTHWLNALEEENVTLRRILSNTGFE